MQILGLWHPLPPCPLSAFQGFSRYDSILSFKQCNENVSDSKGRERKWKPRSVQTRANEIFKHSKASNLIFRRSCLQNHSSKSIWGYKKDVPAFSVWYHDSTVVKCHLFLCYIFLVSFWCDVDGVFSKFHICPKLQRSIYNYQLVGLLVIGVLNIDSKYSTSFKTIDRHWSNRTKLLLSLFGSLA